jgi:hypothetical protein
MAASVYVFCNIVLEESETCLIWWLWRIAVESSGTTSIYCYILLFYWIILWAQRRPFLSN